MNDERRRNSDAGPGLTPVVGRLMMANAIVLMLLQSVFTAPAFGEFLRFDPARALERPWTFLSYMFAHGGLGHFAATSLGLFVFGPSLERRLGARSFLLYYLYCGVGAAVFCLGLGPLLAAPIPPYLGASGAVLGLAFAWGSIWPDREVLLFPLPLRLSARSLVILLATAAAGFGLLLGAGVAHLANLGGLVAGYLFFRIQGLRESRATREPKAIVRRPVMAPIPVRQGSPVADIRPAISAAAPAADSSPDALDRVLDKISASGLKSLTPEERHFLDEIAKRKRNDSQ